MKTHFKLLASTVAALVSISALMLLSIATPGNAEPTAVPSAQSLSTEKRYIRFVDQPDGTATLETSIIRLRKGDVTVDLIGAIHIADAPYFEGLNTRFKDYDAMLYEMVKPRPTPQSATGPTTGPATGPATGESTAVKRPKKPARSPDVAMRSVGMLQSFMKDALGLRFQLDEVDYSPNNFVHADLLSDEFTRRSAERGQEMWKLLLRSMTVDPNDPAVRRAAAAAPGPMDIIRALQAPDRQSRLKRLMGETMENADEMLDSLSGPEGSVIIDDRNARALEVLTIEMESGKKRLAVFYGAGHMKKMEETMLRDMGFIREGEPEWLIAWTIPKPLPQADKK